MMPQSIACYWEVTYSAMAVPFTAGLIYAIVPFSVMAWADSRHFLSGIPKGSSSPPSADPPKNSTSLYQSYIL
jgi:hypothetical protein